MQIDLVVFDVAGTTVFDGDAVHSCFGRVMESAGVVTTREAINHVMGMPKPLAITNLVAEFRGVTPSEDEVRALHAEFERQMIDHYRHASGVRAADGAVEVLRSLRARGIKTALDTGFNRPILAAILDRLDWDSRLLDTTVTSDEVVHGRPDPAMLFRAMQITGVRDPGRVAKVGDTPSDLEEGRRAGCALVVGVTSGSHTEAELRGHDHTHLIASLTQLLTIIPMTIDEGRQVRI